MSAFNLILIALIATIAWTIVRTLRQTSAQINGRLRGTDPRQREGLMREMTQRIREQTHATRCPRCEGYAFAMLDRDPWWKCDTCNGEFEGPEHLPLPEGVPESGHPTGA